MNQNLIKFLAGMGSVILILTALLHFKSLDSVREMVTQIDDEFMSHAIITLWAILSFHLIFLAFLAFGASFYRSKACAAFLMAFGAWALLDALIIWTHIGWFEAVPMLGAAGSLHLIAGLSLKRNMRA